MVEVIKGKVTQVTDKGVIFINGTGYNPSKTIKQIFTKNPTFITSNVDKTVELMLSPEGEYERINLVRETIDKTEVKFSQNHDNIMAEAIEAIKSKELTAKNMFQELWNVKVPCYEKMKLSYMQWGDAYLLGKLLDPDFSYSAIVERSEGLDGRGIYTLGGKGGSVLIKVTLPKYKMELMEFYPILNNMNKSIPIDQITAIDVNNSVQRGFVKTFAKLTGLGFYLYRGFDNPDDI